MSADLRKSFEARHGAKPSVEPCRIPGLPNLDADGNPVLGPDQQPACDYFVKKMPLRDRAGFDAAASREVNGKIVIDRALFPGQLLLRTLCTAEGVRLFADEEIAVLEGIEGADFTEAFTKATRLNGFGGDEKNS